MVKPTESADDEISRYLAEPNPTRREYPTALLWWKEHEDRFPRIAPVARKYLATPICAADSEKLFSVSGNVLSCKRSRITPAKAEMLISLHDNLRVSLNLI